MRITLAALVVSAMITPSAAAIWVAVPLEILVDESDLIVVGTVSNVKDAGFMVGARKYDVAVVKIAKVLKALPHVGKVEEISIAQPTRGGLAVSTDIQFQKGQSGVWLLVKDLERDVYWAKHPSQFQGTDKQKELLAMVAAREKASGGKAADGLVARAELLTHKRPAGPDSFEIRVSLKNFSDKPLVVCDFAANRPLAMDWLGPDGKKLKSNHYAWLARAFLPPLSKSNFATLPPGGIRFVGPHSKEFGIAFQAPGGQPSPDVNVVGAGKHQITVTFVNNETGKQFGLERVWTGKATANEILLMAK